MIRVILIALALALLTLVLLPFQLAGIVFNSQLQRIVPRLFHRAVCAIIVPERMTSSAPIRRPPLSWCAA